MTKLKKCADSCWEIEVDNCGLNNCLFWTYPALDRFIGTRPLLRVFSKGYY